MHRAPPASHYRPPPRARNCAAAQPAKYCVRRTRGGSRASQPFQSTPPSRAASRTAVPRSLLPAPLAQGSTGMSQSRAGRTTTATRTSTTAWRWTTHPRCAACPPRRARAEAWSLSWEGPAAAAAAGAAGWAVALARCSEAAVGAAAGSATRQAPLASSLVENCALLLGSLCSYAQNGYRFCWA